MENPYVGRNQGERGPVKNADGVYDKVTFGAQPDEYQSTTIKSDRKESSLIKDSSGTRLNNDVFENQYIENDATKQNSQSKSNSKNEGSL